MERIATSLRDKAKSVGETAALVQSRSTIGCSGFTLMDEPKVVPHEPARQKEVDHLTALTGASIRDTLDGELTRTGLLSMRYPYQSNKPMRSAINADKVGYSDMHLSHMPEFINQGGLHIDFALMECAAVTGDGVISSVVADASDCFLYQTDQIILEVNEALPLELYGIHDIYRVGRGPISFTDATQHTETAAIPCNFRKIAAIAVTNDPGGCPVFKGPDEVSAAIGAHIISFPKGEVAAGRQPASLSPIQSGVGNAVNAVLTGLGNSSLTGLRMYTEIIQDFVLEPTWEGKMAGVSTTVVSLSQKKLELSYENTDSFREQLVICPQEIANNPELVRRLGPISMNISIECGLYGGVNPIRIMGNKIMNGIGGGGDSARNAGLTIFATASVAKKGAISCIVPMCPHTDHTEHDVQVIVTEQGLADLRWKSSQRRTELTVERCAHSQYRLLLREYLKDAAEYGGHTPHNLQRVLFRHTRYLDTETMLPGQDTCQNLQLVRQSHSELPSRLQLISRELPGMRNAGTGGR